MLRLDGCCVLHGASSEWNLADSKSRGTRGALLLRVFVYFRARFWNLECRRKRLIDERVPAASQELAAVTSGSTVIEARRGDVALRHCVASVLERHAAAEAVSSISTAKRT
jgi:hypothetical protein